MKKEVKSLKVLENIHTSYYDGYEELMEYDGRKFDIVCRNDNRTSSYCIRILTSDGIWSVVASYHSLANLFPVPCKFNHIIALTDEKFRESNDAFRNAAIEYIKLVYSHE